MFASLMMFGASYKSAKVFQIIFAALWVVILLIGTNFSFGWQFPLLNLAVGLSAILIGAALSKKHKWMSVFTILIYSVLIDIASFLLFPLWSIGVSLPIYVWNGIVFNYVNILLPIALYLLFEVVNIVQLRVRSRVSNR